MSSERSSLLHLAVFFCDDSFLNQALTSSKSSFPADPIKGQKFNSFSYFRLNVHPQNNCCSLRHGILTIQAWDRSQKDEHRPYVEEGCFPKGR